MDSKVKLNQLVNEKIVFIHSLIVLLVCVIFGAINCFSGNILSKLKEKPYICKEI